jgi:hypothetical protein
MTFVAASVVAVNVSLTPLGDAATTQFTAVLFDPLDVTRARTVSPLVTICEPRKLPSPFLSMVPPEAFSVIDTPDPSPEIVTAADVIVLDRATLV